MLPYSTLAAVDLGSNSFRLQVARVVGNQLYPLDSLREMIRLAAGLNADRRLDEESQARALIARDASVSLRASTPCCTRGGYQYPEGCKKRGGVPEKGRGGDGFPSNYRWA